MKVSQLIPSRFSPYLERNTIRYIKDLGQRLSTSRCTLKTPRSIKGRIKGTLPFTRSVSGIGETCRAYMAP